MNKGVLLAKGLFVNMMNAGDCFTGNDVLANVSKEMDKQADIIYGNACAIGLRSKGKRDKYPHKPKNLETITKTVPIIHPAAFVKTALLTENPFDENLKIAGDYKFFLTMYLKKRIFQYIDIYIADYYLDGISSQNILLSENECAAIKDEAGLINRKSLSARFYYFKVIMIVFARKTTPRWFRKLFGGGKT